MGRDPLDLNTLLARNRTDQVIEEKQNLAPTSHDWQVVVVYAITDAEARTSGQVALDPNLVVGPPQVWCGKCRQPSETILDSPCAGDPVDHMLQFVDDETRAALIARLQEDEPEEQPENVASRHDHDFTAGYDYTLDDGTVVNQPPIPGV